MANRDGRRYFVTKRLLFTRDPAWYLNTDVVWLPPGIPSLQAEVSGSESCWGLGSRLLRVHLRDSRWWHTFLDSYHMRGRPGTISWFLASAWPSLCFCRHLASDWADSSILVLCISVTLQHSLSLSN